jgi:uncharacterized repeat protein (TIGR03803 family)
MEFKWVLGFAAFLSLSSVWARAEVQVLHAFEFGPQKPQARLLQASDGNFYGTAVSGGDGASVNGAGAGCIFRATPAGVITNMASFYVTNGANPFASLVQGPDGTLYGTTQNGGAHNSGTVFSYVIGGALTSLYSFDGPHGANPVSALAFGPDGALYGTTYYGGTNGNGNGTVFRITTNGALTSLFSFSTTNAYPATTLCLAGDGNFYGGTTYGPANGASYFTAGTLYRITPSGAYTHLVGLTNTIGFNPGNTFTLGADGAVYGTLQSGGTDNAGTAFRLTTNGSFTVLASFTYFTTGGSPRGGLTLLGGTNFYGTAYGGVGGYGSVYKLAVNVNSYSNSLIQLVDSFNGVANGADPIGGLVLATDGKFYGATTDGGSTGGGMFFNVATNGPIAPVTPLVLSAGAGSIASLTLGLDGSFYGTTFYGGTYDGGTVFRVTTNGIYTTLATLGGSSTNGKNPYATLCVGVDGALYGAAYNSGPGNVGTLFRVTTNGSFRTLFGFTNSLTGGSPYGGMAVGPDGVLYGTTQYGGTNSSGKGTIFRLNPVGTNFIFTNLLVFNGTNGANPQGALLNGGDGFIYGTTFAGGTNDYGTIFRINTNGVFNTVATFMLTNGLQPLGGLVRGGDGAFYGTGFGNSSNSRRVYRVTANGNLTSLFAFPGNYGSMNYGNLVAGADGYLYDAMWDGGTVGGGLLFRITTNGQASIISSFTTASGFQPFDTPIFGADGNLYGTTYNYGPGGGGTVYRFVFDHITSITRAGTNALVSATGTSGGSYGLYASTNLALGVWTSLGNATATNSVVRFTDPNAGKFPQRFYRTSAQ